MDGICVDGEGAKPEGKWAECGWKGSRPIKFAGLKTCEDKVVVVN